MGGEKEGAVFSLGAERTGGRGDGQQERCRGWEVMASGGHSLRPPGRRRRGLELRCLCINSSGMLRSSEMSQSWDTVSRRGWGCTVTGDFWRGASRERCRGDIPLSKQRIPRASRQSSSWEDRTRPRGDSENGAWTPRRSEAKVYKAMSVEAEIPHPPHVRPEPLSNGNIF